ncbi:MAG TPA: ribulose-phosphate 3-epimerase [Papillibacter sp.]|jgi:ribulose-phosphate 3-epimerase|nr:ribulose-phosphate 3-epimerase [Papillibacter sp.]
MIKIAPSILSANFARLGEDIRSIETADYLHFDVMDGHFVPNISIGIPVLQSVRKVTDMVLDVHLMITEPLRYVADFVKAGADILVFHVESQAPDKTLESLRKIKALGARTGLSLRPKTPWEILLPYLDELDLVLVMTVEPGFGGQSFMEDQLPKIAALRREIDRRGIKCELEVDGGINPETARLCVEAGADVLVAGSAVFGAPDRAAMIAALRDAAGKDGHS